MLLFTRPRAFQNKIPEWREKKLEIFWLPTYSPQLNLIENLWRFMKYEWIEREAYLSWENKRAICGKNFKKFRYRIYN